MNILIIGDFCYPNYMGGSSKHVFDLITNFPGDRVKYYLITRNKKIGQYSASEPDAQRQYDKIKNEGKVKEVSTIGIFNPITYIKHIKGVDAVILQHPIMGLIGGLIAKLFGKPVIYHYHGPLHLEYAMKSGRRGVHYKLLWLMQKITVLLSNVVLTHSDYMRKVSVREHLVSESKCAYLPPYIIKRMVDKEIICVKKDYKTKLLLPRRLTARTGVIEFLNAFLTFPKEFRNKFDVIITGKGELQSQVEKLAERDPTNIKYIGFVSYDELWSLYSKVDSVVVPTLDLEGFGYVILEGFSCGASAIVSETCGGGYEFIKRHLGEEFIFDVYSAESIENALITVMRNKSNRSTFKEIADQYTTDKMINYYIDNILTPAVSQK